jgi:hypothetical protein
MAFAYTKGSGRGNSAVLAAAETRSDLGAVGRCVNDRSDWTRCSCVIACLLDFIMFKTLRCKETSDPSASDECRQAPASGLIDRGCMADAHHRNTTGFVTSANTWLLWVEGSARVSVAPDLHPVPDICTSVHARGRQIRYLRFSRRKQ